MKFLIVTLALAGLAFAQDVSIEIGDMSMSEGPQRVTLDDLKNTLHTITPSIRQRLDSLLSILGMSLDDMEQVLDNPPDEIKQMFGPSGMSIGDMTSLVGDLPGPIKQLLENVN
ncbi:hypothetical protein ACJMK2_038870 [Sinanodonta woodiana]|uniref:Uncharacterized protein n=1 Tax=Sinanodonta woodiana TaxID=1069815 RepID=A0ABD3WDG3_SINWO